MDKHCDTICDDHSQRDQHPFIAYDNFKTLTMHQRDEMVRKTPSAGSPGVGDKNPLLHTMWNELAFKEAQAGGPHMDATGQPDARTVEHVEQVIAANGGVKISRGLFEFTDADELHRAIACTRDQLPWLRRGDPSHTNSGDVASSCVHVNIECGKLVWEKLPYFAMT